MAQFQKAPNLWDAATREALDAGTLKLQPGNWINLDGMMSRFYRHNPATGHVVAFHGPKGGATRKMRAYVAGQREEADALARRSMAAKLFRLAREARAMGNAIAIV